MNLKQRLFSNKSILILGISLAWLFYILLEFQIVKWLTNNGNILINPGQIPLSATKLFLVSVLIFPMLEELIFRLPLDIKRRNLLTSFVILIWFFLFKNELGSFLSHVSDFPLLRLIFALFLTISIFIVFQSAKQVQMVINFLTKIGCVKLTITSSILFTLYHSAKIEYNYWHYSIFFLIVVYFVPSLILSYVRISYGFLVGLLFHVLNNATPYFIILYYSLRKGENLFMFL